MPFGDSPPMHVHRNEDEIFHVLEGRMRFRVDDKDIVAEAGETALAPKGIPHSYRAEGEQGTRCLTITHGNDFESMLLECSRLAESRSLPPPSEPTQAMIDQLARCCARNGIDLVGPPL
ncbi:cupin domain-containing protein [Rhizobium calliandrae]|uniref:Cupin domain-containing protein n=1 Tax=Rhizobium calliandrae TaxID=1312182 RepID=A0ABT7KMM5_9HYPH|nr:cupin domain-containing protein [Rhizobium calliandrae]MDL2408499.1 cupin domain-containing protein [Rhizobium calliandrae]